MAIDLTSLRTYIDENLDTILTQQATLSNSAKWMVKQPNLLADREMHGLITELKLNDGASCGFTATTNQKVSGRVLTPHAMAVNAEWCSKDFIGMFASYQMKSLTNPDLPLGKVMVDDILLAIANERERLIWSGNTGNAVDLMDGFTTKIANDQAIPSTNKVQDTTSTTILERLQKMHIAIGDKRISAVMSAAMYRELVQDLINKGMFLYKEDENTDMVFTLPGTNFKVYGIEGIDDSNTNIYGLNWNELFLGYTDSVDEEANFDFYFDQTARTYRLVAEFAMDVNYQFSENVYVYSK